jgi:hypothetical protein
MEGARDLGRVAKDIVVRLAQPLCKRASPEGKSPVFGSCDTGSGNAWESSGRPSLHCRGRLRPGQSQRPERLRGAIAPFLKTLLDEAMGPDETDVFLGDCGTLGCWGTLWVQVQCKPQTRLGNWVKNVTGINSLLRVRYALGEQGIMLNAST